MNEFSIITDLHFISSEADRKASENEHFLDFIRSYPENLDATVQFLNASIEPRIDCTACGNCCRSLMINVEADEAERLAEYLELSPAEFKSKFLEGSLQGQFVISAIPCHFLENNKCSIYEHRFGGCRSFPNLSLDGFANRIFGTLMHYGRCPIVYNVIEALKKETKFASGT